MTQDGFKLKHLEECATHHRPQMTF